ncbi:phosphatase PAP2-related protein [Hymenobacter sp. H14-R3]|uniref:phosphatase PAP2-related protein n=1 Tax=Hymenobacter sp. H14-R3 TaxID=3046308 RepID=UPI0024BBD739|nr:phosphatase PAP2-related protein [Hymenobacter sp. H14-R3]MDJ0363838.1 phosphatase PAP2-related protein [Hymenobacter sp. H14-R3]
MRVLPSAAAPTCPEPAATAVVAAPAGRGAWAQAWARPAFRWSWLLLLVLLFGVLVPITPGFFQAIEHRSGTVAADPLLHMLPRHDVATPVFVLMYGGVLVAVGWLTRQPQLFLRGLWGYALLLLLRMASIWLVPLAPPLDMVPMADPFTATLFHTGAGITKDLFFSGHTGTVAILALAVRGRWLRPALALVALLIGVLVLVQRVHYTYDVVAAPLFALFAYWLAAFITRRATRPLAD